jgi:hypothetical protein
MADRIRLEQYGQEVVLEVPGYDKDCIEQLLNLGVPCLSVL